MSNKFVYTIGGRYGESLGIWYAFGQIFLLFFFFLFILSAITLTVIDLANIWFLFICILSCALLLFYFSKIYHIEYDANWFYLKRLFYKTQQINIDDFVEVRRRMFGNLYVIFKDKKVLTQGVSKDMLSIWKIVMTNKEYNKNYTEQIKCNIEKLKTCG